MGFRKFLLLFLAVFSISAKERSVCLNMIVKDESRVITRCLASVKDKIDYWVIVDTGSTDGTQKIIKEFLKDIPGELHEKPWVDFEHNRNEALNLARGKSDYLLMIDADEYVVTDKTFQWPSLDKGCYYATVRINEKVDFLRIFLVENNVGWQWKGVLHETLYNPTPQTSATIKGLYNMAITTDGNRSKDPKKFLKDAQVLEKGLEKEPDNSRYVFYLAQCYVDAGEYELALKNYQRRATMGGWDQEVFWSIYTSGLLEERLDKGEAAFLKSYSKAFQYRQSRAEPLYRMIHYYIRNENFLLGYALAKEALKVPLSEDNVYVERWMYEYGFWVALSDCAYQLGRHDEALAACREALKQSTMPDGLRKQMQINEKAIAQIAKK